MFLLEGEAEKRENRLATEVSSLLRASMRADEQIKAKNTLEAAISNNEEDIDELENHLKVDLMDHELVIVGLKVVDSIILQDFLSGG